MLSVDCEGGIVRITTVGASCRVRLFEPRKLLKINFSCDVNNRENRLAKFVFDCLTNFAKLDQSIEKGSKKDGRA